MNGWQCMPVACQKTFCELLVNFLLKLKFVKCSGLSAVMFRQASFDVWMVPGLHDQHVELVYVLLLQVAILPLSLLQQESC